MTRLRQFLAIAASAVLAACSETPTENNSSGITVVPALPAFAVDAKTAIARISALGPPWSEATASEPMADPATGGQATVLTGSAGSAQIFSRVEGTVWQVRLVTGTPGSCGEAAPLVAAFPKVVDLLKPGTTIDEARTAAITAGLADAKPSTHQLSGMTLTVVGGCTHWLTIAVPV